MDELTSKTYVSREQWDKETGICAHCWLPVSNKTFFGLKATSVHITGKCGERQPIPASAFERHCTKPRNWHTPIESYWASSQEAARGLNPIWPIIAETPAIEPQSPIDDDSATLKLLAALEQQNALLRQLAARA